MSELVLPSGDLLVASDKRDWIETILTQLAEPSFVESFTQKVTVQEEAAGGGFWTELGHWSDHYRPYRVKDGVLTIPVQGVLMKGFPYQVGGWATGYEYIQEAVKRGVGDEDVKEIHLDVDSPGGTVAGCFDCADLIYGKRGSKPIKAFANEFAFSAAYALASSADDITVARTGGVGSIGVVGTHVEVSKQLEQRGLTVTLVFAGDKKIDGHSAVPLTDRARDDMQVRTNALYDIFVATVARNRGLDEATVRGTEAGCFMAPKAVEIGLADAVGPLGYQSAQADDPNDEDIDMPNETQSVTQADLDAAVTAATEAATAAGKTEGATAERARISAILGSEEAKSRPVAAMQVAMNTDKTVEDAATFLAGFPEENAKPDSASAPNGFDQAMDATPNPELGAGDGADSGTGADEDAAFVAEYRSLLNRT